MDVNKIKEERSRRPPPPRFAAGSAPGKAPSKLDLVAAKADLRPLADMDLDYVLAMDDRVREIVDVLRERRSVLILVPEELERQEEEAAAELWAALQEVSCSKGAEEEAEKAYSRVQDEAYNRVLEQERASHDVYRVWEEWSKRKGPGWDAVRAWEKRRDEVERKRAATTAKTCSLSRKAELEDWLARNPLPPRPPEPVEPAKPEAPSLGSASVKVTDVKKMVGVDPEVLAAHSRMLRARDARRAAENYCSALQQKLTLISGMQGARNRGI